MRLDHLLSKESTARARGVCSRVRGTPTSITGYSTARILSDPVGPLPRELAPPAPPGPGSSGAHCSVLREPLRAVPPPFEVAARRRSRGRVPAPRRWTCRVGPPRSLRTTERARASSNYSQATKSQRWMPWRQMPMKDVGGCEKPRGAADQASIRGYPNGETRLGSCPVTPV